MSKLVKFELSRQGGAASCKCKAPHNHVRWSKFTRRIRIRLNDWSPRNDKEIFGF
jgi:hypothetical protein